MSLSELEKVVAENDKQRFVFSADRKQIRANQGHSVEIDLQLEPRVPPEKLYHGTVEKFLESIFATGLRKGERHHVHLSAELGTAIKVGGRRGQPVVLEINAGAMHRVGHIFFLSGNGVWLTDSVPVEFISRHTP